MGSSESLAAQDWSWSWSWSWSRSRSRFSVWAVLVLVIIFLIALCLWCCKSRFRLQDIPGVRHVISYRLPQTLRCQVECYGQGQIHHDIMKKLNIIEEQVAPVVLFVYKVSHETEDLCNALRWIEDKRGRNRNDVCAVILLEKSFDNQKKPVEVAHQGMFGTDTVVVRILWQQRWDSPDTILGNRSNKEAMEKVKQSILRCPLEERL